MNVDTELANFCGARGAGTCVISSPVPPLCKNEPCMLGIDEAGRGPVLGPMVYGCVYCPVSQLSQLQRLGCADSKTLTAEVRERLFDKLQSAALPSTAPAAAAGSAAAADTTRASAAAADQCDVSDRQRPLADNGQTNSSASTDSTCPSGGANGSADMRQGSSSAEVAEMAAVNVTVADSAGDGSSFVGWQVELLSPSFISQNMFKRVKYNLNWVSHDAAIGLIRRCQLAGVNVTQVFVDTVGPPDKYQAKLQAHFAGIEFTVAKKADSLFPTVSAASICAKVVRDRALARWQCPENPSIDISQLGSGYPADPVTKKFLQNNLDPVFGFPSVVRFSWSTCKSIMESSAVKTTWEDETADVDKGGQQQQRQLPISIFSGGTGRCRHVFFTDRRLRPAPPL